MLYTGITDYYQHQFYTMKITTTEHITKKQTEILYLLYRFRFLSRPQIQQFLNHKNHTRILPWLKDLTDRKILHQIYVKKFPENTKPSIYFLGNKSRFILEKRDNCNPQLLLRIYKEKSRSQTFIDHNLFIADIYFKFIQFSAVTNTEIHFYTKTEIADFSNAPLPLPDAYITVTESGILSKRYFLDVFDEGLPRFVLRQRVNQYIAYHSAGYWQNTVKQPFPVILLICPNSETKNYVRRFIATLIDNERMELKFYLGEKSDILKNDITADTWEFVSSQDQP